MGLKLIDARLMLSRNLKIGHFWDGETFDKALALPVALCQRNVCYPRRIEYLVTSQEMKEIPFCKTCLALIER